MKCFAAGLYVLATTLWCAGQTATGPMKLRERAEVLGNVIHLSDLLESAPPSLQTAATAINLGRAPQTGSTRVLLHDQLALLLSTRTQFREVEIPEHVTITHPGWVIDRTELYKAIATYLRARGWAPARIPLPNTLHWAESIRTRDRSSRLQVIRADWSGGRRVLQLSVRCAERAACGSFLVEAEIRDVSLVSEVIATTNTLRLQSAPMSSLKTQAPVLVPAGKRALLLLESAGMRISVPVMPLTAGRLGQRIRAREWRGRHIYRAEVIAAGLLRMNL